MPFSGEEASGKRFGKRLRGLEVFVRRLDQCTKINAAAVFHAVSRFELDPIKRFRGRQPKLKMAEGFWGEEAAGAAQEGIDGNASLTKGEGIRSRLGQEGLFPRLD